MIVKKFLTIFVLSILITGFSGCIFDEDYDYVENFTIIINNNTNETVVVMLGLADNEDVVFNKTISVEANSKYETDKLNLDAGIYCLSAIAPGYHITKIVNIQNKWLSPEINIDDNNLVITQAFDS